MRRLHLDKLRFGLISRAIGTALLIGWTLLGGLHALNELVRGLVQSHWGALPYQLALLGAFTFISGLIGALSAWSTFRIEQSTASTA